MSFQDQACPSANLLPTGSSMNADIEIVMLDNGGKTRRRRVVPLSVLLAGLPASDADDWTDENHAPVVRRARV